MSSLATPEKPKAGGPVQPARPSSGGGRLPRRRLLDKAARGVVVAGGMGIIASILAILFVIASEAAPLFYSPTLRPAPASSPSVGSKVFALDVDEYRALACAATENGLRFFALRAPEHVKVPDPFKLEAPAVWASCAGEGLFTFGLADGRVQAVDVSFASAFVDGKRQVTALVKPQPPVAVRDDKSPAAVAARIRLGEEGSLLAAATGLRDVLLVRRAVKKNLMGKETVRESRTSVALPLQAGIRALAIDSRGDSVFAGTSAGQVVWIDHRDPAAPKVAATVPVGSPDAPVTALGLLLGDRTLVVGDARGRVSIWQFVRNGEDGWSLERVNEFDPHEGAVVAVTNSLRDKGFVTLDDRGHFAVRYGTTGRTLLEAESPGARAIVMTPKANGIATIDAAGKVGSWDLKNPHPEVTLRTLFGPVWYEGYEKPEYVWQSTGGTDDFEAKLSLTPLIYGTLKGTFYALLFAVPLAIFSALYVSQFMHPVLKSYVKPALEIMAALPSVVLGFIAGLWLAPRVEKVVPGLFLAPPVLAAVILLSVIVWRRLPERTKKGFKYGSEAFLLVPVVIAGLAVAIGLGYLLEGMTPTGDYRDWIRGALGMDFDQRNSLVVGFAMGFAVVPIIFTITEDSLSNVPEHLKAGSLALGATAWQTATRVVLPTASPGIFSAVMVGFGRAVGETMIVLMATGNTPVMNGSIFTGFRALSANIAVELPEAPEQGTLFRVLFLAALLLFILTFSVNTVAELIRLRLRKKYQGL